MGAYRFRDVAPAQADGSTGRATAGRVLVSPMPTAGPGPTAAAAGSDERLGPPPRASPRRAGATPTRRPSRPGWSPRLFPLTLNGPAAGPGGRPSQSGAGYPRRESNP